MALGRRLVGPRHVVRWLRPGRIITRRRLVIPLRGWRIISLWSRPIILRRPRLITARRPGLITARRRIIALRPGLISRRGLRPAGPSLRTAGFLTRRARWGIVTMILRNARRGGQSQHRDTRGQLVSNLRRYFHPCFSPEIVRTSQPNYRVRSYGFAFTSSWTRKSSSKSESA